MRDQLLFTSSQKNTNKNINTVMNGKNNPRNPVNHQSRGCSLDAKLQKRKSTPVTMFSNKTNPWK
jgi:hypothetical protein